MRKYYVKVTALDTGASKEFNFKAYGWEHLKEKTTKHLENHEKQWYNRHNRKVSFQMEKL